MNMYRQVARRRRNGAARYTRAGRFGGGTGEGIDTSKLDQFLREHPLVCKEIVDRMSLVAESNHRCAREEK